MTIKTHNQQQDNDHQDVHTKKMTIMMKCVPPYKPKKKTKLTKKKLAQKMSGKNNKEKTNNQK